MSRSYRHITWSHPDWEVPSAHRRRKCKTANGRYTYLKGNLSDEWYDSDYPIKKIRPRLIDNQQWRKSCKRSTKFTNHWLYSLLFVDMLSKFTKMADFIKTGQRFGIRASLLESYFKETVVNYTNLGSRLKMLKAPIRQFHYHWSADPAVEPQGCLLTRFILDRAREAVLTYVFPSLYCKDNGPRVVAMIGCGKHRSFFKVMPKGQELIQI